MARTYTLLTALPALLALLIALLALLGCTRRCGQAWGCASFRPQTLHPSFPRSGFDSSRSGSSSIASGFIPSQADSRDKSGSSSSVQQDFGTSKPKGYFFEASFHLWHFGAHPIIFGTLRHASARIFGTRTGISSSECFWPFS